jgi:Restriction endonuclease
MSAADDLHESIFGFRPAKAGTAYERLAAVVLAGLGWQGVRHETSLRPEGRRAQQRLDVTATHPDGSVQRLLVECKDWSKEVGKGTLDALVGVRDQAGFDAAMAVTTKGFTSGALDVAVDENVAMMLLRELRDDDGPFVMEVSTEIRLLVPTRSSVQLLVPENFGLPEGVPTEAMTDQFQFLHLDGSPAETLARILEANSTPLADGEGAFERSADFGAGRLVRARDGTPFRVSGLRWTEAVEAMTHSFTHKAEGEPCLVLEQLDEDGEPHATRLVVDQHLYAWRIGEDGVVVPQGDLD